MEEQPSQGEKWQLALRNAGPYMSLGVQLVTAMIFFAGGGIWLDRRLHTEPFLTLLGVLLGLLAVFGLLFRLVGELSRSGKKKGLRAPNRRIDDA